MGLFTQRPEEPTEWAGLPAEPLRTRGDAELLPDAGVVEPWLPDLRGDGAAAVTSIEIPVDFPAAPDATGADADGD